MFRTNPAKLGPVILTIALLAGCSTAPPGPGQGEQGRQTPSALLEAADAATGPEQRHQLLLEAVAAYQARENHDEARQLLLQIEANQSLDSAARNRWLLLSMRGVVATENARWARYLSGRLSPTQFSNYTETSTREEAAELQARVYELAGDRLGAINSLVQAGAALPSMNQNDRIWQHLMQLPEETLENQAAQTEDFDLQGWLELALSLKGAPLSLEEQSQRIRQWQSRWQAHPAAATLPGELELLASLPEQRPELLALALPLSGPLSGAGQAVREGFLAAYYQDQQGRDSETAIELVDSHGKEFPAVYADLQERNPDLLIGPLQKSAVATLAGSGELPVPVLALNYLDSGPGEAPANLYQFGLAPDDEVREIAQRLAAEGHRNVVLFAPESDWGNRTSRAFRQAHEERQGRILAEQQFQPDDSLRDIVATAFGINDSRARAIQIERTTAMDVEFEPRRRQDIDAIVLLADPSRARQLKPMFAFYYGGQLPVYGSSVIFEEVPDPGRDADLDGVFFTDLPWILANPVPELRSSLRETFPGLASQYDRLFALGADAYLLSSRLPLLDQIPDTRLTGYTGQLSMDEARQIRRRQEWAVFRQGVPSRQPREPVEAQQEL